VRRRTCGQRVVAPDALAVAAVVHAPGLCARLAALRADIERRPGTHGYDSVSEALRIALHEVDDRTRRRWCREFWRARYRSWVEHRLLENLSGSDLQRYVADRVTVEGREHLDATLDAREPVVAFTPHFGSFLMATLRVALEARGRKQLFLFYDPPEVNRYAPTMRRIFDRMAVGTESVFNNRAGLIKVSRGLARGGALGLMPDVYRWEPSAMFVPFLGRFQVFMAGTAFFALRFGARLLPLYCRPVEPGRFRLKVDPCLAVSGDGPTADALFEATAAIAHNMETHIRQAPEHWVYWPRFGRQIEGTLSLPASPEAWESALTSLRERYQTRAPALGALLACLERQLAERHRV
jgi:phosphatidylinositol dimannoside acyltransferase